jgi:hypothetical protein
MTLPFDNHKLTNDLRGLLGVLAAVQRRILANSFLRAWIRWWNWILIGLIVVAAVRTELAGSILLAAVLLATGALLVYAWEWRDRMNAYESACLLDAAAGLKDRLSTSLWFGETNHPEGFLLYQRRDALKRLPNLDVRTLFPIRPAALARRTLLLALAVSGLFLYRAYYPPPLKALLETTWHSQLLQSLLSPHRPPVANAAQRRPDLPDESQALERRESPDAIDASADVWHDLVDKSSLSSNQQPHDASALRPLDSPNGNQSLAQSLEQAFKDMLSGDPDQNPSSDAGPPAPQQRQNSQQPKSAGDNSAGSNPDPSSTESSRNSDQNGAQLVAGAGGQKTLPKGPVESSRPVVTPVVERVALEAKNFKDQKRMPVAPGTGAADLASGLVPAQGTVTINGAEQENIPERYRSYVQHYFEHTNKGQ